jgi:CDP-diacylglycerol--glycerol-3-phosphate 3-phosphatidyltransferase
LWAKWLELLTAPNTLTLFRIVLAFFMPFLLAPPSLPTRIAAFGVFLVAGLTDFWDGYLARKYGKESVFGKILDPIADKFLVLGTMLTFVRLDVCPLWLVIPILAREIVITAIRLRALARNRVLAAETAGKVKTVLQITSIIFSYVFLLLRDHGGEQAPVRLFSFLNLVFLLLAVAVTLYSGYRFLARDRRTELMAEALATGFYSGCLPGVPGTYGSLLGVALYFVLPKDGMAYALCLAAVSGAAIWASSVHSRTLGEKDPTEINADEIAGMLVAYWGLTPGPAGLLAGFILFRLFDILKPPPVSHAEKAPGGWGIVLDDLAAGAYAGLGLRIFYWILEAL